MQNLKYWLLVLLLFISSPIFSQINLPTHHVESQLFLGSGAKQSLVVGFGGSEGGNAWASDYWKTVREQFIEKGYAFLAIGYFGAKGTPDTLNKIAIENIYEAIKVAQKHPQVRNKAVALIGGSRGADLALLIGSYYKDIRCVVGLVASSVVFPGHTNHFTTSCWTHKGKELPFVPVNEAAIPYLMTKNLRGAFAAMLEDELSAELAAIKVEKIKGPILLLSATKDEICPSTPMAEQMINRLGAKKFEYHYSHKAIEGGHAAPLKHFDLVFEFLETHFKR